MAPKTKEKLTAHDKSILSRETILQWYRAKRLEKLRILRDEIISLSASKRDALKAKVIENTKKELATHKSSLTLAQRQTKAREFADALFKFALSKKDLLEFAKKYESKAKSAGGETLYEYWLENNKDKKLSEISESPRYLVAMHLNKSLIRKEAFLLLGLIEKHFTKEEAIQIYKKCWNKDVFSLQPIRDFFSKEKVAGQLGFYYGSRKIRIYKGGFWVDNSLSYKLLYRHWTSRTYKTFTVTGWWTVDDDEKQINKMKGDSYAPIKYLGKAKKKLQGGGYGDEYTGSQFLYSSLSHVRREFKTSKDSGLNPDEEKGVLESLSGLEKELNNLSKYKARKAILAWFIKQPQNEWIQPTQEIVNLLSLAYGSGCGNYLYRYSNAQKKVYILPIQGADVKDKYFGGYLTIKDGKLDKKWHELNQEKTKEEMEKYIGTMTAKQINKEIIDYRLKREPSETIPHDIKLKRTAGMVSTLSGIPKYVYYHEMNKGYFDKVEKQLTKLLKKRRLSDARAQELARIRVGFLKSQVENLIENDDLIKEAIDEEDKVKLEIIVDSKDEVQVLLADTGLKRKMLAARRKAEDAETSMASVEGRAYSKLEARVEKMFGPAAPVVMWILEKVFKVKDAVKKVVTGKSSSIGGMVLGALGISVSRETIGSRKMTQSRFDKLLRPKRKTHTIRRKLFFGESVKLKGRKLIIPEGKGIIFEKSMPLHVKGLGRFRAYPPKQKKGVSLGAILGRVKKSKYQYKDHKIVIEEGTTIPKGTIIPKGAKIKRIS